VTPPTGSTRTYRGCEIQRRVVRIAYPRNGNLHNPTVTYAWDILRDGKLVDRLPTLRAAKAEIERMTT
jgi:hypothetical protein